jgi:IS1 family transposase
MLASTRLFGDGKHGQVERIQTFRGPACRSTFTSRRGTPLYRLKTPAHQIAMVLSARACGLDPSEAPRVFGFRQATITIWLSRAGEHAHTLHERFCCHLHLPYLQLDELRTRLRRHTHVLWLWLAIDPRTKILPVLHLGPRTQNAAHAVIHALRRILAAFLPPTLHERWSQLVFLCPHRPFWILAHRTSSREESASVAGGGGVDLRPGEKKLPTAQAGTGHPCHAPWNRVRSQRRFTGIGTLRAAEHSFYRERVNLTVRHGVAALARRTWATSQQASQLLAHLEWWRAYYHFVRSHASLRIALMLPRGRGGRRLAQRYRWRTPAMAAGRTNRRWTAREVLSCPLPKVSA